MKKGSIVKFAIIEDLYSGFISSYSKSKVVVLWADGPRITYSKPEDNYEQFLDIYSAIFEDEE